MKYALFLLLYNLFLPVFLLISLPGYLIKMYKRGGFGTGLSERFGLYLKSKREEPQNGLYIHAVSVGEVFIALKFIREWLKTHPESVVLATSTATGHQIIRHAGIPQIRALYSPLDIPGLPSRCLSRFRPRAVVLIEAELWPNFGEVCRRRHIPLVMLNARLSPRSEKRYRKVRGISQLLFSTLSALGVQNERDRERFSGIGADRNIIAETGSIKFDVLGDEEMPKRMDFMAVMRHEKVSRGLPVVLAASTHAGEESLVATAARQAGAAAFIVPRHAERRNEVCRDLQAVGFTPFLRTSGIPLSADLPDNICYVADTTGELRYWTALADVVVIGKSFLAKGGQNPVEAIASGIPVIVGKDMSNFADLVAMLVQADAVVQCDADELSLAIRRILEDPESSKKRAERARSALSAHSGATKRSIQLVERFY